MIQNKRVLAYIPARSGSKSIKDKNIVDVCGKPLIAYSIEAAKQSKYVDKIIVSTDSPHYAKIVNQWGAETPFLRPSELAQDTSVEMDSCQHLIQWLETNSPEKFDIIVKLEPTSVLRIGEDVDKAVEQLIKKNADTVVTVTEAFTHPFWMNVLPDDHSLKNFITPDVAKKNRQQLPKYYQLDGLVYVAQWNFMKQHKTWFAENAYATITPNSRAVDVDGPTQLEVVRTLVKQRQERNNAL